MFSGNQPASTDIDYRVQFGRPIAAGKYRNIHVRIVRRVGEQVLRSVTGRHIVAVEPRFRPSPGQHPSARMTSRGPELPSPAGESNFGRRPTSCPESRHHFCEGPRHDPKNAAHDQADLGSQYVRPISVFSTRSASEHRANGSQLWNRDPRKEAIQCMRRSAPSA